MNVTKPRLIGIAIASLMVTIAAVGGTIAYSSYQVPGATGQAYNMFVTPTGTGTYNVTTTYCGANGVTNTAGTGYQQATNQSSQQVNQLWNDLTGVSLSGCGKTGYYYTPPEYNHNIPGSQQYYTWDQLRE